MTRTHQPSAPVERPRGATALRSWPWLLAIAITIACGSEAPERASPPAPLPEHVEVLVPDTAISVMAVVETLSEEVANRFIGLADKLRLRDYDGAREWFTDDFAGVAPASLPAEPAVALPLDVTLVGHDVSGGQVVGPDGWLESTAELLQSLSLVESSVFKVKAADFAEGSPPRGRITFQVTLDGRDVDGGMRSIVHWAWAEVVSDKGRWLLRRWQPKSLELTTRAAPLFSDVSVPAGIGHKTPRFGQGGKPTFYWNGAAAGDVDGDGLWDLFVPSTGESFLYRNRGDGRFDEQSEARGLGAEAGGTGALFFDYDNDGDADLAVAHVGWAWDNGTAGGQPLRLYRNDEGRFTDVSEAAGFAGRHVAFSLSAGDFDGNGFTDVYVCAYNRMDAVYPDSWFGAQNGTPNALYMNQGDGSFREQAAERGADDGRWTFAAAGADFDEDGDLDLYLANDYGDNALLVNDGQGRFTDRAREFGLLDTGNGMGTAWGDVDADGHLDLYVANMSSTAGKRILSRIVPASEHGTGAALVKLASGNSIFRWDPAGGFARMPSENGGTGAAWAWGSAWLDIDLDGDNDVMVANGFITGESAADT